MSECAPENYESEYKAPLNSVFSRTLEGNRIVTQVFMEGEWQVFDFDAQAFQDCWEKADTFPSLTPEVPNE